MLTPLPSGRWNYATAAHLLNRAAFGATPEEIEAARAKGLARMVRELVEDSSSAPIPTAAAWATPRNIRDIRMAIREEKDQPDGKNEKRREFRQMEAGNVLAKLLL